MVQHGAQKEKKFKSDYGPHPHLSLKGLCCCVTLQSHTSCLFLKLTLQVTLSPPSLPENIPGSENLSYRQSAEEQVCLYPESLCSYSYLLELVSLRKSNPRKCISLSHSRPTQINV